MSTETIQSQLHSLSIEIFSKNLPEKVKSVLGESYTLSIDSEGYLTFNVQSKAIADLIFDLRKDLFIPLVLAFLGDTIFVVCNGRKRHNFSVREMARSLQGHGSEEVREKLDSAQISPSFLLSFSQKQPRK